MLALIKQRGLDTLREYNSIVSHYPEDRAAKAIQAFLKMFTLMDVGEVVRMLTVIRDSTREQLAGRKPWPVHMTPELIEVNREVERVFTAVLDG